MAVKTQIEFRSCSPYDTFRAAGLVWKNKDVHDVLIGEAKRLVNTFPNMFSFIKELTPFQKAQLEKEEKKKAELEAKKNKSESTKDNKSE